MYQQVLEPLPSDHPITSVKCQRSRAQHSDKPVSLGEFRYDIAQNQQTLVDECPFSEADALCSCCTHALRASEINKILGTEIHVHWPTLRWDTLTYMYTRQSKLYTWACMWRVKRQCEKKEKRVYMYLPVMQLSLWNLLPPHLWVDFLLREWKWHEHESCDRSCWSHQYYGGL